MARKMTDEEKRIFAKKMQEARAAKQGRTDVVEATEEAETEMADELAKTVSEPVAEEITKNDPPAAITDTPAVHQAEPDSQGLSPRFIDEDEDAMPALSRGQLKEAIRDDYFNRHYEKQMPDKTTEKFGFSYRDLVEKYKVYNVTEADVIDCIEGDGTVGSKSYDLVHKERGQE